MYLNQKKLVKYSVVYSILFLFFFSSNLLSAAENKSSSAMESVKRILKKINFVTTVSTSYDSNIFLAENNENSDTIGTFSQYLSYRHTEEPFHFKIDYAGNISYYLDEGDDIYSHISNALFSYRPFDKVSFGIGNYFKMMRTKSIATTFGDRLLSRGYQEDTPLFEAKIEPIDKLIVDLSYQYYYLDAAAAADDYIDRGDNIGKIAFNYDFFPALTGFVGCRYQDAHFPHLTTKDAESVRGFAGITKKFKKFNLTAEVGQEHKDTNFQSNDANTDALIKASSTFSAFTTLNLILTYNKSLPSARREYFQYFTNSVAVSLWHVINPKTSISTSLSYSRQKFDSSDVLSGYGQLDKTTGIYGFNTTLTRNLNDTLSFNLGYSYTKRNTDFAKEGYTDNKVSVGLTARY